MKVAKIRKMKQVEKDGNMTDYIGSMEVFSIDPSYPVPSKLTMDDVWGKTDREKLIKLSKGMVVATEGEMCPHFGDKIPYKSVTIVCDVEQEDEVSYWIEYNNGRGSINERKELFGGEKLAIRTKHS